ncbi:MAG: branched-chain amino acid ABC transporter permease [Candidatus Tectomicrobia bacterium]|nr:branched-chain amino acid ABC transporter permease [Candidatus Tectomicrobia bacterium]
MSKRALEAPAAPAPASLAEELPAGKAALQLAAIALSLFSFVLWPGLVNVYQISFVFFGLQYVVLASSWNIISGFTGYVSFGHVAFFGIGSYTTAILVAKHGWPWYLTLPLAGLLAVVWAAFIGFPCLRLKGPYFAISMMGLNEVLRVVALSWESLTGGGLGITMPNAENSVSTYYAGLAVAALTVAMCYAIAHSRFGLRLAAIREDETAAEAMGVPTTRYKMYAFMLSAFWPGVIGGIVAYKLLYIEPDSTFFIAITVNMITMAMLGGKGTVLGPVIGAAILYTAQELVWWYIPWLHLIAYGAFIILIVLFVPRGIMGYLIDRGWVAKGVIQ